MANIEYFECSKCGARVAPDNPPGVCAKDGGTFWVRYDLEKLRHSFSRALLAGRSANMWRYAEVLPEVAPVTLGEGFTPLLRSKNHPNAWIKDEGLNPTGSFKARGLSAAVTMARAWGKRKLAIPSAGNAASALAAYAAAAELEAYIFMPRDVPLANRVECQAYGARVTLVDGLIGDCARLLQQQAEAEGWYDVSTLKEPFRVEGKKTMAYEVAEQMGWRLPDAIIYPTGGGVGLIGMWKALEEMQALGWVDERRPKMIAVQSAGCAPIPKAFHEGREASEAWPEAATVAAGLRVPKAYGDYLILSILRESRGTAVAVSDAEIMAAVCEWARDEGVFAAPEGAASLAAYKKLVAEKFLAPEETVVLFNTGSGLKYLDVIGEALSIHKETAPPPGRQIGGIIAPY